MNQSGRDISKIDCLRCSGKGSNLMEPFYYFKIYLCGRTCRKIKIKMINIFVRGQAFLRLIICSGAVDKSAIVFVLVIIAKFSHLFERCGLLLFSQP